MIDDNFNYSAVDVVLSNQTNHQREMVNSVRDVPDGRDGRDGISGPPGPSSGGTLYGVDQSVPLHQKQMWCDEKAGKLSTQ